MTGFLTIPPQAVDVERHVIGAMLLNEEATAVGLLALMPDDFYKDVNRVIFNIMRKLFDERTKCDCITVANVKPELMTELLGISAEVVTTANIADHCAIVKDKSLKRKQIAVSSAALERGYSEEPGKETQDFLEREIFKLNETQTDQKTLRPINDVLAESFQSIARKSKGEIVGLSTGIACLDKHTGGLQAGDLVVIGGRPGHGKTSLVGQIGIHCAKGKKTVAFFEGEMKDRAIIDRALFAEAGVNQEILRHGSLPEKEYPKLSIAVGQLTSIPFFIDDTAGITPMQIRSKCRRLKQGSGLDLIVIDNIQRMKSDSRSSDLRVRASEVSAALKEIAKEFSVPVLAVSHIRRLNGGEHTEPTLSDLQESGNIEQDADIVMLMHRTDMHKDADPGMDGMTKIIFAKFREGSMGYKDLFFEKTLVTFYDWDSRPTPQFNHRDWET